MKVRVSISLSRPRAVRAGIALAILLAANTVSAGEIERQLQFTVTVEGEQSWNNGGQWSKATTKQRYELTTRLKSDGVLQVRNLEDLNQDARLQAKTVFLARQAKKQLERMGLSLHNPLNDADRTVLSQRMQADSLACKADAACFSAVNARYAAIFSAIENPDAMQPDAEPGTYLYFLPYSSCPQKSRVVVDIQIDGVRIHKSVTHDSLVPFSEHHSADAVDVSDGLRLCDHSNAVIDTQDKNKSLYLDNVYVPSPPGITEVTESGRTVRTSESQPLPSVVLDWMTATLRHAAPSGSVSATLPLTLSLNGNSTELGLWQGAVKANFQWSFTEVAP